MKIAYFINQYPMVSHSFIRREILALEDLGYDITRIALRSDPQALVDARDKEELAKTRFVLQQSVFTFLKAILSHLIFSPMRFLRGFKLALRTGWKSERGVIRHIFYFAEACVIAKWLRAENIQHVHAHFGTNSTTVVMLANALCSVPYSFTVHGPEEFDKPVALSLSEKVKRAAFVVAISSFGKSQLFRWLDHDQWSKVKIVHCGLDSAFHEGEINPVDDVQRFISVGRLCEQKAQPLLLEAFHILAKEGRDFKLTFAGDGHLRAVLEQLIADYGLSSKVTITGWISAQQVRDELLNSRALVLPSFAEGLPVVIMEAMALQRPVISSYVAGIPELIIPGENGWLVTAGDVNQLVEALREVMDAKISDLRKIGKMARVKVLERHDVNHEARKLATFFEASRSNGKRG